MAVHLKYNAVRFLLVLLAISMISTIILTLKNTCDYSITEELTLKIRQLKEEIRNRDVLLARAERDSKLPKDKVKQEKTKDEDPGDNEAWGPHKLAIVVPYRERFEEMMEFVPFMHKYLSMQHVRHRIYIVNQIDSHRFNRASLCNVGYIVSKKDCDYLAIHDVDLLPKNPKLSYRFDVVAEGPHHLSSPELHPKYHYKTFIGGILLMKASDYEEVNGMSNRFWGWGREDDEFYKRLKEAKFNISKPEGLTTGYETFYHIHDRDKRKRDMKRYFNQHKESFKRDLVTGLDTIQYEIRSTQDMLIDGAPCTILHVKLECDLKETPWCDTPQEAPPPKV